MTAREEIEPYIRLRDGFLALAEEVTTGPRLDRATIANEAVEAFLAPLPEGSVYGRYRLPEPELTDARQRCEAVKVRIEQLRARISNVGGASAPRSDERIAA